MSKIKAGRLISSALAAMLFLNTVVMASEPQDIIDAAQMTPQQFNYQTTEVVLGSLIKETKTAAEVYYPLTYNIRFDQNNAKFVEYTVTHGDTVKAGDVLARFTIEGSEAELTRMELNLQRTEEQTAEGIREREQEISNKRAELARKKTEISQARTVTLQTSAVTLGADDEVPEESSEAPEESGEVSEESSEAPEESGEVPEESSEAPEEGSEVPEESSEAPEEGGEVSGENSEAPDGSDEIPGGNDEVPGADDTNAAEIRQCEIEILELTLEKLEAELKQYKYRQQYSIDQQREALEEEKVRRANNVLVAPVSGIVSDLVYKKVDDAVSPDETLMVISSEEVVLLAVRNDAGDLRYNMPVEVQIGSYSDPTILTGRVVAADDAIPEKERTGYAFIQMEGFDAQTHNLLNPKVIGESVRLDNVLLISRDAAMQESGKYYVNKLTDGMVQKRYIEAGLNDTDNLWVIAGVEEGETLIQD